MAKRYTFEDLKQMTPERRLVLDQNAKKRLAQGGQEIVDLIKASGLPLRSGGMLTSDPVYLKMEEIIWAQAGQEAAMKATEQGKPALCGVEPLLTKELGDQYGPHDQGTMNAGYIVGELMRYRGYRDAGPRPCPKGSVAKTAMFWVPAVKN